MGHTMVPLNQAIGGGLEHDCATWEEIFEDEENADNAWNDPSKAKGSNNRTPSNVLVIAQRECSRARRFGQCQAHCEVRSL